MNSVSPPPDATTDTYPVSPLQQGMLFHALDAGSPGVDMEQIILTLPEAVDWPALQQAWRWAAQRHAILRTAFPGTAAGQPCQQVDTAISPELAGHDWRTLAPAAQSARWEEWLDADRRRGFRPDTAPLWRVAVMQFAPEEYRLVFSFHHLLLDGRGLVVLLQEIFGAYEDFRLNREPALPPPAPYRRYIDWLQTRDRAAEEAFWRHTLAGLTAPTLPALPAPAREEPSPQLNREQETVVSAERTATLRAFAQANGLTMNTLLQGAWALLLGRYTGEPEVVFGAVRACRHAPVADAAALVGLLINTVPLRVALPSDRPVLDWLRELRGQWVALRPYEHTPLSDIRGWSGFPQGRPLFETLFNYQEPGWDAALQALGGAWSRRGCAVRNQPGYPLALDAIGGETLRLRISFDPVRFGAPAIQRMLGHLTTLLSALAEQPAAPLAQLPLLTSAELEQVLVEWNHTAADYDEELCVHHLFEEQAARSPEALAVADERRHLTYHGLNEAAGALARRLHAMGVGREVCVGVCVERSVDLVVALLAVLKAGGAYVPLDPAYPAERLAFMLGDAQAPVLLTQLRLASRFATAAARVVCLDQPGPPAGPVAAAVPVLPSPDDLAYLIYTSGSTGTPKGVAVRHRNVANLIAWHQRTYQVTMADRATQLASPAFDASVWELWPYLTAGASVHFPPEEIRLSPAQLVRWLTDNRITLTFLPTPLAEAMMDEPWPADTALRAILTGGDRLRRWPGDRLPCSLVNHYGPTECTVVATSAPVPAEGSAALPPIGAPIANTVVYVLDRHRQPVPAGVPGELFIGGAGLARGYHHQPGLTEEKFPPNPFHRVALQVPRLYRTGDLVRWREDGQLEFLGRLDHQVKIRGHRIEPGEIEAQLNAHPAVRESLVLARADGGGEPQLVAYVLTRPLADPPAFDDFLQARLPGYMVPAAFIPLEAWPLTPNGKVDRARLPAPAESPADDRTFVAPQGELQGAVAQAWSEVLGRTGFGAHDDFFALGGHSLRAAQVVSRLGARYGVPLSVRHLFEHPTIAGLAGALEKLTARPRARPGPAIPRLRRDNSRLYRPVATARHHLN